MPVFDVRHYHQVHVNADPSIAYRAFRVLDLENSRIVRLLFAIRNLFSKSRDEASARQTKTFVDSMLANGWRILEENPGHEMVLGAATKPWAATVTFHGLAPAEFIAFSEPGFTKIVWNIAAKPFAGGGAVVSTETRVLATDPHSRRRFRRYWLLVNPGIRLIRRVALARLQSQLREDKSRSRLL